MRACTRVFVFFNECVAVCLRARACVRSWVCACMRIPMCSARASRYCISCARAGIAQVTFSQRLRWSDQISGRRAIIYLRPSPAPPPRANVETIQSSSKAWHRVHLEIDAPENRRNVLWLADRKKCTCWRRKFSVDPIAGRTV